MIREEMMPMSDAASDDADTRRRDVAEIRAQRRMSAPRSTMPPMLHFYLVTMPRQRLMERDAPMLMPRQPKIRASDAER